MAGICKGRDEKDISFSFPVTPILLKSLFYKTGMCLFNVGKSIMEQKQITTPHAPAAIGPYSQAIRYGQFIYTSGQIPLDPVTGKLLKAFPANDYYPAYGLNQDDLGKLDQRCEGAHL